MYTYVIETIEGNKYITLNCEVKFLSAILHVTYTNYRIIKNIFNKNEKCRDL